MKEVALDPTLAFSVGYWTIIHVANARAHPSINWNVVIMIGPAKNRTGVAMDNPPKMKIIRQVPPPFLGSGDCRPELAHEMFSSPSLLCSTDSESDTRHRAGQRCARTRGAALPAP